MQSKTTSKEYWLNEIRQKYRGVHPISFTQKEFLWGGHPARPGTWTGVNAAARSATPVPQEFKNLDLHNWDAPNTGCVVNAPYYF
ncbi:MAG: hypothetical protein Fur006_34600 [Coleofasciculaceae cyanobacterium]